MIVDKKQLKTWKALYEHGDFDKIEKKSRQLKTPVTTRTISKLFKLTPYPIKANENTIEVVGKYYTEKKERQESLKKQILITEEDGN